MNKETLSEKKNLKDYCDGCMKILLHNTTFRWFYEYYDGFYEKRMKPIGRCNLCEDCLIKEKLIKEKNSEAKNE